MKGTQEQSGNGTRLHGFKLKGELTIRWAGIISLAGKLNIGSDASNRLKRNILPGSGAAFFVGNQAPKGSVWMKLGAVLVQDAPQLFQFGSSFPWSLINPFRTSSKGADHLVATA